MAISPELKAAYDALKQQVAQSTTPPSPASLTQIGESLAKLKILLAKHAYLLPAKDATPDVPLLTLTRETLEIGAQWSVRVRDIDAFERYMAQLYTFYHDYKRILPPSDRSAPLTGLNLLRLLAQSRIADFHTTLESLDESVTQNPYVQHAVQLEQHLMEGAYNRVWAARQEVPAEEFTYFTDILMSTIREDIGTCSERAYSHLPIPDAISMLYLNNLSTLQQFATRRGWMVDQATGKVYFNITPDTSSATLETGKVINTMLTYAKELEQIV